MNRIYLITEINDTIKSFKVDNFYITKEEETFNIGRSLYRRPIYKEITICFENAEISINLSDDIMKKIAKYNIKVENKRLLSRNLELLTINKNIEQMIEAEKNQLKSLKEECDEYSEWLDKVFEKFPEEAKMFAEMKYPYLR